MTLVNLMTKGSRKMRVIFLLLVLAVLGVSGLYAETEVEGEVSGEWTVEGSPYIHVGDLVVPEDRSLIIRPGVTVRLGEDFDFIINGEIQAEGTEEDTIFFRNFIFAPSEGMQIINSEGDNRFSYCSFNSLVIAIRAENANLTVSNSFFQRCRLFVLCSGGEYLLENVTSRGIDDEAASFDFGENEVRTIVEVRGCRFEGGDFPNLAFGDITEQIVIRDSYINGIFARNSDLLCFDDTIGVSLRGCNGEFYNNYLGLGISRSIVNVHDNSMNNFSSHESRSVLRDNKIEDRMAFSWGSEATVDRVQSGAVDVDHGSSVSINNSVVHDIHLTGESELELDRVTMIGSPDERSRLLYIGNSNANIINSIFINSNVRAGIYLMSGEITGGYNCFLFNENRYERFNGLENDFAADPLFRNWYNLDLRLRADSPCIDAGDPDSPRDADDTRADVGAYMFDQENGMPPCVFSPIDVTVTRGLDMRFLIRAVDEDPDVEFSFEGLPEWMEVVEDEEPADSIILTGNVPEDQEDFVVKCMTTDVDDMTDSLTVSFTVDSMQSLHGRLSGVLSRDGSPYLITDSVFVAAEDTMIIESGCDIYFRTIPDQHPAVPSRLKVYGTILAQGVAEDSIKFIGMEWYRDGYVRMDSSTSTGTFDYCYFSIGMITTCNSLTFRNCTWKDCTWGLRSPNDTITIAESHFEHASVGINLAVQFIFRNNTVVNSSIGVGTSGGIWNVEFTGNQFSGNHGESEGGISVSSIAGGGQIANNIISGAPTGIYTSGRGGDNPLPLVVRNNRIIDCTRGMVVWWGSFLGSNNLIANCAEYAISITAPNGILNNNIIVNSPIGIKRQSNREWEHPLLFCNNVLLDVDSPFIFIGDFNREMLEVYNNSFWNYDNLGDIPDGLGILSRTNENGDSTDQYFNLFTDPYLVNVDEGDYRLFAESPLRDAGNPDTIFIDIDGSVNDIGLFGGVYGSSYEYPVTITTHDLAEVNSFELTIFPNPFNSTAMIPYELPERSEVQIDLFDLTGRRVEALFNGQKEAGHHSLLLRANGLASGVYIIKMTTPKFEKSVRIVQIK